MAERCPCVVPFCGRTTKGGLHQEWICGEHWRGVHWRAKKVLARARRRRDWATFTSVWVRVKAQAIEVAAGVSRW